MFSYTDSVFEATNTSPAKDLDFQELPPSSTNTSFNHNSHSIGHHAPMYPFNDMIYSLGPQHSTTSLDVQLQQHHHHHQLTPQQQQWQEPPLQHQQQQQQHTYFTEHMHNTSVDHASPYDHYNSISPFSSPVTTSTSTINNNNTNNSLMMGNNSSQRSSIQSLPSVQPIPSTSTSIQQHQHQQQSLPLQHQQQQQSLPLQHQQQHPQPQPQQQQHQNHHHHHQQQQQQQQNQRPRITTSLWDDEGTVCYQVDVRGICVARRQDNDMVNGTKLLNVTGMSRGKRDGILKNEKGRVVVKVGAMHLKGVWVTFARAKALAIQFNIVEHLHPLFVDDPALYFYSNQMTPHSYFIPNHPIYLQSQDSFSSTSHLHSPSASSTTTNLTSNYAAVMYPNHHNNSSGSTTSLEYSNYHTVPAATNAASSNSIFQLELPSAPSVPSMIPVQQQQQQSSMSVYGYTTNNANVSATSAVATNSSIATVADIMNPY